MSESSFQAGFGGGCGLVLGVMVALVMIPVVVIIGCGTLFVAPVVIEAQRAAVDATRRAEEKTNAKEDAKDSAEAKTTNAEEDEPTKPKASDKPEPKDDPPAELKSTSPPLRVVDAIPPLAPGFREWADISGRFKVVAKYSHTSFGKVILVTEEGKTVAIEEDQLSGSDRTWLRENKGRARKAIP